ncbi:MAG: RNA polymerase sigma factor, partial [Muribaculaceae bacterium]|nr:RNA polymerase sigma factor [Muribaculaceae bacterium]
MQYSANDKFIIEVIRQDRDKGFRLLIGKYKEPIYWHIRRITVIHDDAEDAMQETFIRIFRALDTMTNADSLTAWIYRIATNEALRLRSRHKDLTLSIDDCSAMDAGGLIADDYIDFTDIETVRLQKAILSLPPKQQAAFNLRYYDDMTYEAIAQIMETSPG